MPSLEPQTVVRLSTETSASAVPTRPAQNLVGAIAAMRERVTFQAERAGRIANVLQEGQEEAFGCISEVEAHPGFELTLHGQLAALDYELDRIESLATRFFH